MKKILPTLLVLLLSMAVIGCGPLEEEEDVPCAVCGADNAADCICKTASASALTGDVVTALTGMSINVTDVLCPLGTTYHDFETYGSNPKYINIIWTDANQSMYNNYKAAWMARAAVSNDSITDKSTFAVAQIMFYTAADNTNPSDPTNGVVIPANSIVLNGRNP